MFSLSLPALAQDAPGGEVDDPTRRPAEHGLRFTPGFARFLAGQFTKEVLVGRYELDAGKADQVTELVARRLMQMAHENEENGQEAIEFLVATGLEICTRSERFQGITPELGMAVGKRVLPVMPGVHKLIDGVVDDVRPMLGFKAQLKLTGELTAAKVALGYFQEVMERWSKGGASPFENPFNAAEEGNAQRNALKKDKNGQTKAVNAAREQAENQSKRLPGNNWDDYVEEASKYFGFDASQVAAAQSLVRDYKARALIVVGGEGSWRNRQYQIGFGLGMVQRLPPSAQEGVRWLLHQDLLEFQVPLGRMKDELFDKIEATATQAQREAAERRGLEALAAAGFDIEKEAVPPPARAIHEEITVDQPTQK